MLVLSRKVGEAIVIENEIIVRVLEVRGQRVRLGIEAPSGVGVWREELAIFQDGEEPAQACFAGVE